MLCILFFYESGTVVLHCVCMTLEAEFWCASFAGALQRPSLGNGEAPSGQ